MYEIGDVVRVKDELVHVHGDPGIVAEMHEYCGKELTIRSKDKRQSGLCHYRVMENTWNWDERWLEPLETNKYDDIVEEEFASLFTE